MDPTLNEKNAPLISSRRGLVNVRVIRIDEEGMIARPVQRILADK